MTMAQPARPDAVLVRGDRTAAVGDERACPTATQGDPAVVDLAGATVLPGFVDARCHPLMLGPFPTRTERGREAAKDTVVKRLRHAAGGPAWEAPVPGDGYASPSGSTPPRARSRPRRLNTRSPPFDDPAVRQAVAYATDRRPPIVSAIG
jgi:predicted amidohydrolase YtcJ